MFTLVSCNGHVGLSILESNDLQASQFHSWHCGRVGVPCIRAEERARVPRPFLDANWVPSHRARLRCLPSLFHARSCLFTRRELRNRGAGLAPAQTLPATYPMWKFGVKSTKVYLENNVNRRRARLCFVRPYVSHCQVARQVSSPVL